MRILFLAILSFSNSLFAQNFKSFFKLSRPEKCWVISHPFVAKKAYKGTKHSLQITQEIKKQNLLDTLENGGQLDAFRHAYWMAVLTHGIGAKKAWKLGKAHEKGNYIGYKKRKLEEGYIPDSVSLAMDFFNNKKGIEIGKEYNCNELKNVVISDILEGKMKIIYRDQKLNSLDCNGEILPYEQWFGSWRNNRCLVNSNIKN
ncbi:MAG: hypothetical protein HND27_04090 [Bacteroidetes bacterium]|nr:hypothetical protein [Bacteroidota bacterium]MBV6460262.1 hypothetical protein [Flavobacteriales bacterium]WKZ74630.1 MAG: hypothetical protein QY303_10825 [Vicingaceae bacterium]MCL4815872.1 hypothetical protein [Flavobacteriales bacterium]NOG94937.1 hypothetical protein [Bacteroidota bacterium]